MSDKANNIIERATIDPGEVVKNHRVKVSIFFFFLSSKSNNHNKTASLFVPVSLFNCTLEEVVWHYSLENCDSTKRQFYDEASLPSNISLRCFKVTGKFLSYYIKKKKGKKKL